MYIRGINELVVRTISLLPVHWFLWCRRREIGFGKSPLLFLFLYWRLDNNCWGKCRAAGPPLSSTINVLKEDEHGNDGVILHPLFVSPYLERMKDKEGHGMVLPTHPFFDSLLSDIKALKIWDVAARSYSYIPNLLHLRQRKERHRRNAAFHSFISDVEGGKRAGILPHSSAAIHTETIRYEKWQGVASLTLFHKELLEMK